MQMFTLALSVGIYSYLIFGLGILGLLYKQTIIIVTALTLLFSLLFLSRKNIWVFRLPKKLTFSVFLTILLVIQVLVNLVGALGPELGFDALWYHLTLPKIYFENHSIDYIPGGLLYYSAMPKLTEMLYVAGLALGSEIFPKLIHFSFGILCLLAIYKVARKFLSKNYSLLVLVLFYSNLVVGWMSITAYIDLARTFFEMMALWAFLEWIEKKEQKWLVISAVMLGFAISTKLLAMGSLFIFSVIIILVFLKNKKQFSNLTIGLFVYWLICLLIPLPWFVFSFVHTGNPVYPFFTNIYPVKLNFNLINPLTLSDPISPIYVIFLPTALFLYGKFKPALKIVLLYSFLAVAFWHLTPQTGGGRFILPYLPALSLVSILVIALIRKNKLQKIFIWLIIFLGFFSIFYRGIANFKYVPVILGAQSKSQFLSGNLNFSFGDFYDTDGYFAKKIKEGDKVLLYGFHNLYYVNFPFIDASYVKKGDMFNYIAVQEDNFPERFKFWNLIYYNKKTDVKLYSIGGLKWAY